MLQPKLRFPSHIENWSKIKLKDVSKYYNGGSFENDVKVEGRYELVTLKSVDMTGNLANSNRYLDIEAPTLSKNTLIMILSEQSPGLLGMTALIPIDNKYVLNQRVAEIRPNSNVVSYFLSMVINRNQRYFSKLGAGTKVQNISKPNVENFEFLIPSLPEQQKIASFLSTVDEKIQLLKKQLVLLEQYKKGVMQKIFSREIRFKDEEGNEFPEWELITLGECLDYEQPNNYLVDNTEYSDTYPTPVVTAGKTFILGYTNEKNGIFANNLPVIIFDDFTTSSQFVSFPFKAKSSAMKILKAKPLCSVKFLFEALQMIKYEVGGHGRHWISVFSKLEILIPNHIEQQKISSFLSSIDEKIDKNKNQISKMELWKKGLLQQMFC
jgi:type I restriction enzyme S subunit